MEGDGETVVAIIQGLRDAGLAVTLVSGTRPTSAKYRKKVPARKYSVQTSTDCPKRAASAQICDSQYTSSYQAAHCQLKPTSPSPHISEFPEQRRAPSRTKGNFRQVGCFGCGESTSPELKYQRNQGSFRHSPSRSFPSDSFIDSLRKYPIPIGKSASTEIIQRLLYYTQAKHCKSIDQLSETYNYLKVPVSGRRIYAGQCSEVRYLNDVKRYIKKTIRQMVNQTPVNCPMVRSRYMEHCRLHHKQTDFAATCNRAATTNCASRKENEVNTEPNEEDNETNATEKKKNDSCIGTTPSVLRPEVQSRVEKHRMLSHKQTGDSATDSMDSEQEKDSTGTQYEGKTNYNCLGTSPSVGVCPKAFNRYRSYRKLHHREELDEIELNDPEKKTKAPVYCNPPPGTVRSRSFSTLGPCSKCAHKEQETWNSGPKGIEVDDDTAQELISDDEKFISDHEKLVSGDEELVTDAKSFLSDGERFVSDDDIEAGVLEWVTQLPVYINNTKENQNLIHEMAQELAAKLKYLKCRDDYTDVAVEPILDFLSELPAPAYNDDAIEAEMNEIINAFPKTGILISPEQPSKPSKISYQSAANWLQNAPNLSAEQKKNNKNLAINFDQKLNQLKSQGADVDTMQEEMNKFLISLHKHGISITPSQKRQLFKNLINEPDTISNHPASDWLENAPNIPQKVKNRNNTLFKDFDNKLQQLKSQGTGDDIMQKEVNKFLESLPEKGIFITPSQKNHLASNLVNETKSILDRITKQPATEWLENALNIPEKVKNRNKSLFQNFDDKLKQLKSQGADNDIIQEEIKDFLDSLPQNGILISPPQKSQLAKNLLNQTTSKPATVTNVPAAEQFENASDLIEVARNKGLVQDFSKNDIYMTPAQRNQLARNLINQTKSKPNKINSWPATEWLENEPNVSEKMKSKNKSLFKNFDMKLQQLKSQNAEDEIIEAEIDKFASLLPKREFFISPSQKNQMFRSLQSQIKSKSDKVSNGPAAVAGNASDFLVKGKNKNKALTKDFDKNTMSIDPSQRIQLARNLINQTKSDTVSSQRATEWLENVPNISEKIKNKSKDLFVKFDQKLEQLKSQNADRSTIQEEINTFLDSLPKHGITITPFQKSQLAKNLVNETKSKPDRISNRRLASEWLENLPNVPENIKDRSKPLFQDFDDNMQQLKSQGAEDSTIRKEINIFLDMLPMHGISITHSQKSQLAQNLVNEMKSEPDRISNCPASEWLENALNVPEKVKDRNELLFKNFDDNMQQLKSQGARNSTIRKEINIFLDSLPKHGISITPSQKSQLAKNLANETKSKPDIISNWSASEWLENAPNISEKVRDKNKTLFKDFDDNMQQLKYHGADNSTIQEEINIFLDSLPMHGISITPSQTSQLTKNLVNGTKSEPDTISNRPASEWLENAPNISEKVRDGNKTLFKDFDDNMQQLKSDGADDSTIQEEINIFLDSLPMHGISISPFQKSQLVKNLVNETKSKPDISNWSASEWLANVPNIPEKVKDTNIPLFQDFDDKLQQLKSNGGDDSTIQEEINIFLNSLPLYGISITPSQKSQLAKNLVNETKPKSVMISSRPASEWLENAPNISEKVRDKNKTLFKDFDDNMQQLKYHGADNSTIQEEINIFLDSLPMHGISITPSQKSLLTKNLVNGTKSEPDTITNRPASEWLENTPNVPEKVKDRNKSLFQDFDDNLQQLKSQGAEDSTIRKEINIFMDSLPKHGISITPFQKSQLAKNLVNETKSKTDKISNRPASEWLENVPNIPKKVKDRNKALFQDFDDNLQQLKSQGANDEIIGAEINEFLDSLPKKRVSITPSQRDQLAKTIVEQIKSKPIRRLSIQPAEERLEIKQRRISMTPQKNQLLQMNKYDMNDVEAEIRQCLDSLFDKKIVMTPKEKVELIKRILNEVRPVMKESSAISDTNDQLIRDWARKNENIPKDTKINKQNSIKKMDNKPKVVQPISDISNDVKPDLKQRKRWEQNYLNKGTKDDILNNVSNFINDIPADISDRKRQEIKRQIADLLSDNMNNLSDSDFKEEIQKILVNEANMPRRGVSSVADALIKKIKDTAIISDDTDFNSNDDDDYMPREKPKPQLLEDKDIEEKLSDDDYSDVYSYPKEYESPEKRKRIKSSSAEKYQDSSSFLARDHQNFIEENLKGDLLEWLTKQELYQNSLPDEKTVLENLTRELADNLTTFLKETPSHGLNIDPILHKEIKKYLRQFPIKPTLKSNQSFMDKLATDLLNYLKDKKQHSGIVANEKLKGILQQVRQSAPNEFVQEAVNKWIESLDLPVSGNAPLKNILSEAKADLVSTLLSTIIANEVPSDKIYKIFQDATTTFLNKIPQDKYKTEDIKILGKSLAEILETCAKKDIMSPTISDKRKAADVLLDDIANWARNLPVESDTSEEKIEAERIKQQLEAKLVHKIGELNINPAMFNDDISYLDILGDEVEDLIGNIRSENIRNKVAKLKKDLLDIVTRARRKTQEETIAQIYKLQLREAIEQTLPRFELPAEGQSLFKVLKENVADAFINMHYVGNKKQDIDKLKQKIYDEIGDFCHAYSCPALTIDTRNLLANLFNVLENIREPQNESFKNEVELLKLKDEIDNFVKVLPLNMQNGKEKLQANKNISILTKKLYDIENTRTLMSDIKYEEKMRREITQFLNKLPLTTDDPVDINYFTHMLIKNLKNTEQLRRMNALTRHSIHLDSCSCYVPSMPLCTLSKEDQDHLERIRQRTSLLRRRISFKDIPCSPCHVDIGSQTDINCSSVCPIRYPCLSQTNSSAQTPCRHMPAIGSQIDLPLSNGYRWNSICDQSCGQLRRGICSPTPFPCNTTISQHRRPISPSHRPCTLTNSNRPITPHLSEVHPSQTRLCGSHQHSHVPCLRPEHQTFRPAPCRPEQLLQDNTGINCTFIPDKTTQRSHCYPHPNPRILRPNIPYPHEQNMLRSEQTPQSNRVDRQTSQYLPRQQCSAHELQGQRSIRQAHTPSNSYQRTESQIFDRSRRSQQENQPKTCVASQSPCQGQTCVSPQSSGLSQQTSSSRNPNNQKPETRISSDEYDAGPSCSFQKRVTHLGSFDHPPQDCIQNFNWDKFQHCHDWEREMNRCMLSDEESSERKRCRCETKCGKYSGRRKSCYNDGGTMSSCSKCCGIHCPFPTQFFFR